MLSAEDQLFRRYALRRSLEDQARVEATNDALAGIIKRSQISRYAKELAEHPTTEMQARAVADAEAATFNDKNTVNNIYQAARKGIASAPGGRYVNAGLDVIFPYVRTPLNIVKRLLEYTPVGAAAGTGRAAAAVLRKGFTEEEQRAFARTLGRAATGSALIFAGYTLAKKGLLTGTRPDDYDEQREMEARKEQPGSILVNGVWVQISGMTPFSNLLMIGADMARDEKKGASLPASAGRAVLNAAQEQPFSRKGDEVSDVAGSPAKQGLRHLGRMVGGIVPTTVSDIAEAIDDKERVKGSSFTNQILARVPGLRQTLPEKIDANGQPVEHRRTNAFNPLRLQTAQTDAEAQTLDVDGELRRLDVRDAPARLPKEKLGEYLGRVMPQNMAAARVLPSVVNSDFYRSLPDDEAKREIVRHMGNYARLLARKGMPAEVVDHNSMVKFAELELAAQVDASELPAKRKEQLKDEIAERLRYARVFEDERRELSDIEEVFEREKAAADVWLRFQTRRAGEPFPTVPEK